MIKYLKTFTVVIVFLLTGVLHTNAQQNSIIKIQLLDNENFPVKFASILISDSIRIEKVETFSDMDGKATIILNNSIYKYPIISVSAIGYKNYTSLPIKFRDFLYSDTIYIDKSSIVLNEIKVFDKQIIRDGEKLIYRPIKDQFSSSTTTSEIFTKLPGVSLNRGNLKINGSEGVLILIDGKGELKTQSQQLEILSGLNSDKIDRIEIIPVATSKYDANINSIINVITKKDKGNSTVRMNFSQPFYMDEKSFGNKLFSGGLATNINFQVKDIRFSLITTLNNTRRIEDSKYERTIYDLLNYNLITNSEIDRFSLNPYLTLDYDINSKSSISLNTDISLVPSLNINSNENYNFINIQSNTLDSNINLKNNYSNKRNSNVLNGSYKLLLNKINNSFFYFNLTYSKNFLNTLNNFNEYSSVTTGSLKENDFTSNTNIYNASAIVENLFKLNKVSTEIGLKSNLINNNTNQNLNANFGEFEYKELLSSIFFNSRIKFSNYLLILGVRGELINSLSNYKTSKQQNNLEQDYFKIYPNLLLQKDINENLTVSLGYSKKIRRPFLSDLNPSQQINNYLTNTAGNIGVRPIFSDRIQADFRYKETGITLYYEQFSGRQISLPTNDPFTFQITNLDKLNKYAISFNNELKVSTKFSININSNYSYTKYPGNNTSFYKNGLNTFETSGSGTYQLNKKSRIQTDFYYQGKMNFEYTVYRELFSNSVTYRHLFLKNKIGVTLSINDPLGIEKINSENFYPNQYSNGLAQSNQRIISLQANYNFPLSRKFKNQTYNKKNDGEIRDQK